MDLSEKHKLDDLYRGILELEVPNEIVKEFL